MSLYGLYPVVSASVEGDGVEYGVNDLKLLFRLFNGVDIDRPVKIRTKWAFEVSVRQKAMATPTPDTDYGQWYIDVADSNKPKYMKPDGTVIDLSTGAPDASTSVKGIVELAVDLESVAGLAVQSNDTRLSDARIPTTHTHVEADITDLQAYVLTSDSRLSDARTPLSHSHLIGDLPGTLLTTSSLKFNVSVQSGNGTTKAFNIAHGFGSAPTTAIAIPASNDAIGPFITTKDATNIIVTFPVAPPTGTNNLSFHWIVL